MSGSKRIAACSKTLNNSLKNGILASWPYRTEIHQTAGKNFAYVVQTQQIRNVLFH